MQRNASSIIPFVLLSVSLFLFCTPSCLGQVSANPLADISLTDWRLSQQVRRHIQGDAILKNHNLGVSVKDRVVTIWGKVPNNTEVNRSIEKIRDVPGVATIIDDCRRINMEELTDEAITRELKQRVQPKSESSQGGSPKENPRTEQTEFSKTADATFPRALPQPQQLLEPGRIAPTQPTVENRKERLPPVVLGDPEKQQDNSLEVPAEKNGKDQPARFQGLSYTVRNGRATISGRVSAWQDAWDYAEWLQKNPAVDEILFGAISKRPGP